MNVCIWKILGILQGVYGSFHGVGNISVNLDIDLRSALYDGPPRT
jgi:hypothetical protein